MYESPAPEESQQSVDLEQRTRVANEVGPVAVWRRVSAPFRGAWERLRGHGQSGAEIPISPEAQWAEDAAAQEGFHPEDAPYLAYDQLRNRYQIPDTSESRLSASAAWDLAALEHTEVVHDKGEGITFRRETRPLDLFTGTAMRTAYIAARLEAGVTPSQFLHMNRKERQRLDNGVHQRARALHGAFIHDAELAEAFDAYVGYLTPQLSPERRRVVETRDQVLPWVLVEQSRWWAEEDSPASEYKRGQ